MSAEFTKWKFVRRSPVRLWHRLSVNLLHGFLSNFSSCFPWVIRQDVFFNLKKNNGIFFIVFVNLVPYASENFKTLLLLQIATEILKLFLNFLLNGPHKTTFGIFEN